MFEFHGWAVLEVDDADDPDCAEYARRMAEAQAKLTAAVESYGDGFCIFEVRTTCNDLRLANVHGLRNHAYAPVIELFGWIATNLPWAYGLLYIWDDEDTSDFPDCFRVWRLARGVLTEEADPFLSPRIPVVEPSWSEPDGA